MRSYLSVAMLAASCATAPPRASYPQADADLLVPLLREAFRAYGLATGEGDPAVALAQFPTRPPQVREAFGAALDEWIALAANPQNQP